MELQYLGGNCIKIIAKKTTIIIDDNLAKLGLKSVATDKDIVLSTGVGEPTEAAYFVIDRPGEYEVSDVSIQGVAARSHMDEAKQFNTTMYRILIDGIRIVVTGHIHPDLSDKELETLGTVDILVVPIGGNGYTLDGVGAQKVVKEIEPKILIPTHYDDAALSYEVPQTPLDDALKALAMEPTDRVDALKIKPADIGEGSTRLIVVNRK